MTISKLRTEDSEEKGPANARCAVVWFQELTAEGKSGLMKQIDWTEVYLLPELSPVPYGFNFGLNDGEAAGQTVVQFHLHIIPRYSGDVPDPLGGIRGIIPTKAPCWKDG